jgi:hypothetical protein
MIDNQENSIKVKSFICNVNNPAIDYDKIKDIIFGQIHYFVNKYYNIIYLDIYNHENDDYKRELIRINNSIEIHRKDVIDGVIDSCIKPMIENEV